MTSKIPPALKRSLIAIVMGASATTAVLVDNKIRATAVPLEIQLAREIGIAYESGGKHIGVPYIDKVGRGQPLTVCAGVTGAGVIAGKYYTEADCEALELPRYYEAAAQAKNMLVFWDTYDPFVRASFIDFIWNVGPSKVASSTAIKLANNGDLTRACMQMPRWVYGTVRGQNVILNGLVSRRGTTEELCSRWRVSTVLENQ